MAMLAGTSRGIFDAAAPEVRRVLECRGVRELVRIEGRVFAGSGEGLYVSDDDGASWARAGLDTYAVWQVRSLGDGRLLAGTQRAGLFLSDDGAASWHPVGSFNDAPEAGVWCVPVDPPLPAAARALVIDSADPQRVCAGVEVGGIMRSLDGGATWRLVLPGENPDLHMLFQHPAKPDVLFATTGYGRLDGVAPMEEGNAGLFYSKDFGATWEYRWQGIQPRYARPLCIDTRAPYAVTVASAPTAFSSKSDADGAGAMLFRSEDEGVSWRSLCDEAHSPSRANFHGLTPDPAAAGGVLVGTDTGELWRVSADRVWEHVTGGLPAIRAVCAW